MAGYYATLRNRIVLFLLHNIDTLCYLIANSCENVSSDQQITGVTSVVLYVNIVLLVGFCPGYIVGYCPLRSLFVNQFAKIPLTAVLLLSLPFSAVEIQE